MGSALRTILHASSHTLLLGVIFRKGEDVREAPRGRAELWLMLRPPSLHFIVFPPRLDYKLPLCVQKTLYQLSTLDGHILWKSPMATVCLQDVE